MGLAIVKQRHEWRQVDAVGVEVHGLNSRNRTPEIGVDASGVDPGIDRSDSCGSAINRHLRFAERRAGATEEFVGHIVGNAGVPEFVIGLALGEDVEKSPCNVGGQRESLLQQITARVQAYSASRRTTGKGNDLVGDARFDFIRRKRVKQKIGRAVQNSGIDVVHDIAEIDSAGLSYGEDRTVVRKIALDMPVPGDVVRGLGGGSEIDVGGADPDVGRAIELAALIDGEVCLENYFGPGAGTCSRRRVGESLGSEVGEFKLLVERDDAGRRFWTRHRWIGESGVARSDFQLRCGHSREQE